MDLERLEGRELLTLPGVTVQFGNLMIKASLSGGNNACVSIDSSNHYVKLTLNGSTEEFNPATTPIYNITYFGGANGGDTFTDNTSMVSLEYGYGGNNDFTGGTGYNYVYFWGNDNTFNGQSSTYSDVWEHGGTGDTINGNGHNIQVYH